jgi:ABC-2 type transport system permease protein
VSAAVLPQVGHLARRSVLRTLRQPAAIVPSLTFPLMLLAVNAAGLDAATEIPGFPTDSYLTFVLAFPFIQGGIFATMSVGQDLARDIQTGFLNRLSLTPLRGAALLMGQLAGIVVLALGQAVCYLAVGLAIGVRPESGPLGWLVLLLLAALIALGFGAIGATLALRTGSGEAVQGMFPVLFVFLFISSMNMPRHLIEIDWFRIAATVNPISYLLEGVRSLIIEGWNWEALALGFGFTLAVTVVAIVAATAALRVRMERT